MLKVACDGARPPLMEHGSFKKRYPYLECQGDSVGELILGRAGSYHRGYT